MKFDLIRPCDNCPFRSDKVAYLSEERVREICDSLLCDMTFSCHKTNSYDDDGVVETKDSQHCAGALIFLERINRPNQLMRIAERLGFYDRRGLDMSAPVFKDADAMAEAQGD